MPWYKPWSTRRETEICTAVDYGTSAKSGQFRDLSITKKSRPVVGFSGPVRPRMLHGDHFAVASPWVIQLSSSDW